MKIGLLCAMRSEFDQLTPYLHITRETEIARTTVLEGDVDGMEIALAATGICKVNAAITAQLLIDRWLCRSFVFALAALGRITSQSI